MYLRLKLRKINDLHTRPRHINLGGCSGSFYSHGTETYSTPHLNRELKLLADSAQLIW